MKKHLVILTGAGISAESGLRTFRDSDGLWEGYNVEDVATPQGFAANPQLVLDFYNSRRKDVAAAQPNAAHKGIAALEKYFNVTVITQNIDDLHERGGSKNVLHLHGEIFKMRSVYNTDRIFDCSSDINVGDKAKDGGQLRPHIVWFNESVPMLETAIGIVETAAVNHRRGNPIIQAPDSADGRIRLHSLDMGLWVARAKAHVAAFQGHAECAVGIAIKQAACR